VASSVAQYWVMHALQLGLAVLTQKVPHLFSRQVMNASTAAWANGLAAVLHALAQPLSPPHLPWH
jgi:hypothetical protein